MARECNHMTARRTFGDLTVIARATSLPNGIFRCNFACKVIPAHGEPMQIDVMHFYDFLAAEEAARIYKEGRK